MGRLIDANANREQFKKLVCETLNDDYITTKKKFELIMTAFDSMPTAYDVDAVEEELLALPQHSNWNPNSDNISRSKAIDAVRKGGVE